MSAAMLRQMLEEAGVFMKEEKYQQALDSARRVSQFDANNFQALMCVGLANFHLKQWEDSETALRRAADLKPDLPGAWKNLVDLFDASGDTNKKVEVLDKLIHVFRKGSKIKPSQKWMAELAANATTLRLYGKAFDAWYSLVDETQELPLEVTPNEELPPPLIVWLHLMDLLQLPNFNLSDAQQSGKVSMETLLNQFVAVAQRWNWTDTSSENESVRAKTDVALAMFMRYQLNRVKTSKTVSEKQKELTTLDVLTSSLVEWFPTAKLPVEYLLLRSEDQDSPIDADKTNQIATRFAATFAKSPMSLMFQGFAVLTSDPETARALLVEGLASCSASSFHESAFCVRAQVELASLCLETRDVEGCLSRLHKAQEIVQQKTLLFGCGPPKNEIYSAVKLQLLHARAYDVAGQVDKALDAYKSVLLAAKECSNDSAVAASVGAAELLCSKQMADKALALLDSVLVSCTQTLAEAQRALIDCSRAWALYQQGDVASATRILAANASTLSTTQDRARALKRLAIAYWYVDNGSRRSDKQTCFTSLLQAAKLAPLDGEVFAWLGKWYLEIAQDVVRAEKCFLKALSLSPQNELAGMALSGLYSQQGKNELNVSLWEQLTASPESAPTWALLHLAQHLVDHEDEAAVGKLHLVLRNERLNAQYWLSMGHVYRHFGKLVAAQRSYLRAMELGEGGWCVLTELARIEGSLHQFDDALVRIQQAVDVADASSTSEVIATVYAELLFEQAKYLNGEGLYGRAAGNIKKAAALLQPMLATTTNKIPVLKLLGDIHSFAFYLSPLNFAEEKDEEKENGWIRFMKQGRHAYEQIVDATSTTETVALAQAQYDVGVSCWYEARALYATHSKSFHAFGVGHNQKQDDHGDGHDAAVGLLSKAREHLQLALSYDASFGLAWNALGVVVDHPLAKQLAWVRAVETTNCDAAWANLGMLYVFHHLSTGNRTGRTAELARNAFLHLQAVNANNPAMWIGYGLLYLGQESPQDRLKARESFQCALEMGNHVDALLGFVVSSLLCANHGQGRGAREDSDTPSNELLLFATRKYLEREAFDSNAWSLLSVVQLKLGLENQALRSSAKSVDSPQKECDVAATNHAIIHAAMTGDHGTVVAQLVADDQAAAGGIIQAQQAYEASDPKKSLQIMRGLLGCETLSDDERGAVASFALALSTLSLDRDAVQAKELAQLALAVVGERIASCVVTKQEMDSVERFHRVSGSLESYVATFQDNADSHALTALARVDLMDPRAFTSSQQPGFSADPHDSLHWLALKSLLTSDDSSLVSSSLMKLVRAAPGNPYAYALAALGVHKKSVLSGTTPTKEAALASGLKLLDEGLRIASASSLARVLLHWAYAVLLDQREDSTAIIKGHADKALASLQATTTFSTVETLLWEARILTFLDRSSVFAKYAQALHAAVTQGQPDQKIVLAILYELGGMCESFGLLDAAHHVWKTVMSWKSPENTNSTAEPNSGEINVTAFVGNLHLAIVHATKNNPKSAKKFSKTAIGLASATGESSEAAAASSSSMLTTARFLESVLTNM